MHDVLVRYLKLPLSSFPFLCFLLPFRYLALAFPLSDPPYLF